MTAPDNTKCEEPAGGLKASHCEDQGMMLDEVLNQCIPCYGGRVFDKETRQCIIPKPLAPIKCGEGQVLVNGRCENEIGSMETPLTGTDRPAGPPKPGANATRPTPPPKPTQEPPGTTGNLTGIDPSGGRRPCPPGQVLNAIDDCVPRNQTQPTFPLPEPDRPFVETPTPDPQEQEQQESRIPAQPTLPTEKECEDQGLVLSDDGTQCVQEECGPDEFFDIATQQCEPLPDTGDGGVDCFRFPDDPSCTAGGGDGDDDDDE
jgi:hypothetical protein